MVENLEEEKRSKKRKLDIKGGKTVKYKFSNETHVFNGSHFFHDSDRA